MDNGLLQDLMMGAMGAGGGMGAGAGAGMPAAGAGGGNPFGQHGMSPQLMQFASGALSGRGFQGGIGKLMGGILAQKMRERMQQQMPGNIPGGNSQDFLLSGDPGSGMQTMG